MKKIITSILLLSSITVFSQTGVRFGLKAGANLSLPNANYQGNSLDTKSNFGFWGGGLMEVSPTNPNNKFKIQLEALYSDINSKINITTSGMTTQEKFKLQQINLPLVAKYFIIPSISINAGPTFNFNINSKESPNDLFNGVKSFQMGAALGATFYIYKGLFIDGRYNPLFGQVNNDQNSSANYQLKLSSLQLGIGYKF